MMTDSDTSVREVQQLTLSVQSLAKALDISVRSAHRLLEDGEIESIKIGAARVTMRVPVASVKAYVDRMRTENAYVRSKS